MASNDACLARMLSYMNTTEWHGAGTGSARAGSGPLVTAGLQPESVNFTSGCGGIGIQHNADEVATANVIKINTIDDLSGGAANTFVTLSSCDGTNVFSNITKPGVYVVKGQSVLIVVERRNVNGGNASECPASSTFQFELESLERYCGLGYAAAECKTVTAISPALPTYKRSMMVALFTACVTLVTSVIAQ